MDDEGSRPLPGCLHFAPACSNMIYGCMCWYMPCASCLCPAHRLPVHCTYVYCWRRKLCYKNFSLSITCSSHTRLQVALVWGSSICSSNKKRRVASTHTHAHTRKLVNQSHFKLSMLRCMDRQKDSSLPSIQNITPLAYRQSDVFTVSLSSCLSLALHSTVVLLKANLFKCLRCDYSCSYCKATVKSSWFFQAGLACKSTFFGQMFAEVSYQ